MGQEKNIRKEVFLSKLRNKKFIGDGYEKRVTELGKMFNFRS